MIAQLLFLEGDDREKEIKLYINSPGGSITAGMAIFDAMQYVKPDVSTLCVGLAASMGAFLLSSPDHKAVFNASYRILKPDGIMIWVIMHPCFQSPFSYPMGDGSRKIVQYDEQFWKSQGSGTIRSTLGAYHRPLSSYINDFIGTGFTLLQVDELERDHKSIDVLPSLFAGMGRKLS